jgi:hypothetical protein
LKGEVDCYWLIPFLAHIFLLQPHHEVLLYAHFEAGAALFMSRRRFETEIQELVFKYSSKESCMHLPSK